MKLHDEQFQGYKKELTDIDVKLFSLEIAETDDLMTHHAQLNKALFNYSVRLRKLFEMHTPARAAMPTDGDARGVKFPRSMGTYSTGEASGNNLVSQYTVARTYLQRRSLSICNKP